MSDTPSHGFISPSVQLNQQLLCFSSSSVQSTLTGLPFTSQLATARQDCRFIHTTDTNTLWVMGWHTLMENKICFSLECFVFVTCMKVTTQITFQTSQTALLLCLLYFWLKVPWVLQYVIYDPTKNVETRTYGLWIVCVSCPIKEITLSASAVCVCVVCVIYSENQLQSIWAAF